MCNDTGGQAFVVSDLKQLMRQVDELVHVYTQQRGLIVRLSSEEVEKHASRQTFMHVRTGTVHPCISLFFRALFVGVFLSGLIQRFSFS